VTQFYSLFGVIFIHSVIPYYLMNAHGFYTLNTEDTNTIFEFPCQINSQQFILVTVPPGGTDSGEAGDNEPNSECVYLPVDAYGVFILLRLRDLSKSTNVKI
jgi:hypothetical protein